MRKGKLKIALFIDIDEDAKPSHTIGEVVIDKDGEIKRPRKQQTLDIWIKGLLSAIITMTDAAHTAGVIDSAESLKECISVLKNGFISIDKEVILSSNDFYKPYLVDDEKNIYRDPISLSENEVSFIHNLIQQKPHYNLQEANLAKGLFDYFGFSYDLLPGKVLVKLEREF